MFVLMTSWMNVKNGVETKSLGQISEKTCVCSQGHQISEKPCVCSRVHIFRPITMKLGQNVCLDEISDEFETGSSWVKN